MSHRRLELPRNSPSQPQEQLARLLQYFQSVKGETPTPGSKESGGPDELNLASLKQALGPQLGGMLDSLPPNAVNEAMKDPAIRNQVKDMLQQFSKDGTLPDFVNRTPKNRNRPGSETGQPNQTGNRNKNAQQPSGRNPPPLRSQGTRRDNPQPSETADQSPQERLAELIEKLRERNPNAGDSRSGEASKKFPRDNTGSNGDPRSNVPESSQGSPSANSNSERPLTESEWEDRLRDLMQKQRDSIRRRQGDETESNEQPAPAGNSQGRRQGKTGRSPNPNSFDGRQAGANQTGGPGNSSREQGATKSTESSTGKSRRSNGQTNDPSERFNEPSGANDTAPSLSEFLEQMQGVPTPDLSDFGVNLSAAGQGNQNGSNSRMSGNLLADAMKQMDPKQLREQAKKALQDEGLRNTLKDILKDAKQSARQEAGSGGGPGNIIADVAAATGMEDTVLEALGGMTEELVEIAKDAKFPGATPGSKTENQQSSGSTSNGESKTSTANENGSSEEKSVFSQFTESASSAIKNFSQTPEAAASGSVTPDILPDLGGGSVSTLMFALLLIVGLIACLFVGSRLMPVTEAETSEQVLAKLIKQGIRSREDVIRAFHQFALKPPHETQDWWTHSRVVDTVVQQYPQHSARIQILAALYEQARYFPDETEFTDAQIQQAAEAVRTVGVA